jgi:hypothetical protein
LSSLWKPIAVTDIVFKSAGHGSPGQTARFSVPTYVVTQPRYAARCCKERHVLSLVCSPVTVLTVSWPDSSSYVDEGPNV